MIYRHLIYRHCRLAGWMHRASDSILRNPVLLLIALCAAQIALWTSVPAIVDRALPLDVVELTMWGHEWVLLSYKHPQLPSWALEIARWLTDSAGWSAYLVSQLFVTATFILVFLLGRDLVGARGSIAGTLMLTGVYYFSWPTPEFNHNVAQMPIWVAVIFLVWRAVSTGRLFWWIALALCAAAGLYTKFSMLLVIALTGIWLLVDPMARSRLRTAGPWIGLLLFFAAISPLARALVDMNYLPLEYAAARSEMQARNPIEFVLAQLADHAGLFAILISASLARTAPDGDASSGRSHIAPRALAFLLYFSLAPLLAMIVLASVSGAKDMWGAPMYSLSGLLAIALFPRLDTAMRHIALWAVAFLVAVPAVYAIAVEYAKLGEEADASPMAAGTDSCTLRRALARDDAFAAAHCRRGSLDGGTDRHTQRRRSLHLYGSQSEVCALDYRRADSPRRTVGGMAGRDRPRSYRSDGQRSAFVDGERELFLAERSQTWAFDDQLCHCPSR